ncbi:MAG: UDP-N-acetylmuramate--L-alanine ligase [Clostridia bacterium]|nr:UDP-N-acetylmuramate--L-alanine ligase [Clostridia bacterium]
MATLDESGKIHFVGIGGCSMSGLARILHSQGHGISGSDREENQFTKRLEKEGIPVFIGHRADQAAGADLLVYSAAIRPDNPERVFAREHGIPEMERSVALGQISERFSKVVAIAGCHGKTTITSMLAYINEAARLDATVHVGGYMELLDGGVAIGAGDTLITEACEYVESFLTLSPTLALINNIDNDHLDCYRDIDHIVSTFFRFCSLVPPEGKIIGCIDDPHVCNLLPVLDRATITYGLFKGDFHAANIEYDALGNPSFELIDHGENRGRISLSVPATHNVINALAAYAVSKELNVPFGVYSRAIAAFTNTKRRFEFMGERDGIRVFHDYAHHPNEIKSILEAASRVPHNKLFCVFQCNSYTRARTLFCTTLDCFNLATEVLVPDIYPGREKDTGMVHSRDMVAAINASGARARYLPTFDDIRTYLDENASKGDLVLTVGSGDVYSKTALLL